MKTSISLIDEPTVAGSETITIQVCLLTYKRPVLLRSTLQSLLQQKLSTQGFGLLLHILVVDNDINLGGRDVVDDLAESSEIPLRYVSEPARGLSKARNRALEESKWADYIAFIDDDETAQSEWLIQLVEAAVAFKADVVTGPVHPLYESAPRWVEQGGFFRPTLRSTGDEVTFVATNNVLLRNRIVSNFRFDDRFDHTGGEDTEFFMRVKRAGHKIVWAQEAAVSEIVPATRANLRWILDRARSDANRYTRSCLLTDNGPQTFMIRFLTAIAGFFTGLALLPAALLGRHHAVRGLQLVYRSFGTLTALRGRAQIYYRPAHD